jgi:hypothetical protein
MKKCGQTICYLIRNSTNETDSCTAGIFLDNLATSICFHNLKRFEWCFCNNIVWLFKFEITNTFEYIEYNQC